MKRGKGQEDLSTVEHPVRGSVGACPTAETVNYQNRPRSHERKNLPFRLDLTMASLELEARRSAFEIQKIVNYGNRQV